jgi:hypothetical protein
MITYLLIAFSQSAFSYFLTPTHITSLAISTEKIGEDMRRHEKSAKE